MAALIAPPVSAPKSPDPDGGQVVPAVREPEDVGAALLGRLDVAGSSRMLVLGPASDTAALPSLDPIRARTGRPLARDRARSDSIDQLLDASSSRHAMVWARQGGPVRSFASVTSTLSKIGCGASASNVCA